MEPSGIHSGVRYANTLPQTSAPPRYLLRCSKITAARFLSIALAAFGAIFGDLIGYIIAIQPVLEKRLDISSTVCGFLLSSLFGGLIVGILVTILTLPHHKPLWMAGSIQLCGIFTILAAMSFSHFGRPDAMPVTGNTSRAVLCDENFLYNTSPVTASTSATIMAGSAAASEKETVAVVGIFLWLIGFTAALPCVVMVNLVSFSPGNLSIYILLSIGPIVGFIMGACYKDSNYGYGGFSVGFVVVGIALNGLGLLVGLIPKSSMASAMTTTSQDRLPGSNINLKNTVRRLGKIIRNVAFLGLAGTLILDVFITTCYIFSLPRYLQIQFDVPPSVSNIAVALGMVLPYGMGALALLYSAQFLRLTPAQLRMLSVGCVAMSCFGYLIFVFLGCGSGEFDHERQLPVAPRQTKFIVENICNNKCDCFRADHFYHPVCHLDTHVTFASPCLAGCMTWIGSDQSFGDCHCVENKARDDQLPAKTTWVSEGACTRNCGVAFGAFVFIGCLFHIHAGFPVTVLFQEFISLFIEQETLTVAKHLLLLTVTSVAVLPAPVIAGWITDSTCLLWDKEDSPLIGGPACVVHDESRLRSKIHVQILFAKILLTACYYLIFRYLNRPTRYEEASDEDCTVYYRSLTSTSTLNLVSNTEE